MLLITRWSQRFKSLSAYMVSTNWWVLWQKKSEDLGSAVCSTDHSWRIRCIVFRLSISPSGPSGRLSFLEFWATSAYARVARAHSFMSLLEGQDGGFAKQTIWYQCDVVKKWNVETNIVLWHGREKGYLVLSYFREYGVYLANQVETKKWQWWMLYLAHTTEENLEAR